MPSLFSHHGLDRLLFLYRVVYCDLIEINLIFFYVLLVYRKILIIFTS